MFSLYSRKKTAATIACLVLCLSLVAWVLRPPPTHTLTVRVASVHQVTNGVMLVSVVLTNETTHTFNVVDDTSGKPCFILDPEPEGWPPDRDNDRRRLGELANLHRVNLGPAGGLTHTLFLTNPPSRFRLRVDVLDLTTVRRGFPLYRIIGQDLAEKVFQWQSKRQNFDVVCPPSTWIERPLQQ